MGEGNWRRSTGAALSIGLLSVALGTPIGSASAAEELDQVVRSRDGTPIVYDLYLPEGASAKRPVPAVLAGHGWGGNARGALFFDPGKSLYEAGYAVLGWDARGFGRSGGVANVNDPAQEGQDVVALVDALAADPRIARESPGDPRVGMSGGSYGGGIQAAAAALDRRIDAITPQESWYDLNGAIAPNGVPKTTWLAALIGGGLQGAALDGLRSQSPAGGQLGTYHPDVFALPVDALSGSLSSRSQALLGRSGPRDLVERVRVPTLISQGTTDTLFGPSQAIALYEALRREHPKLPTALRLYCGGHSTCAPFEQEQPVYEAVTPDVVDWMERFVRRDERTYRGHAATYQLQTGAVRKLRRWPPAVRMAKASGAGEVLSSGAATNTGFTDGGDVAEGALEIPLSRTRGVAFGAPRVRLTTSVGGAGRSRLFLQVVNRTRNHVLGNQVTPIEVTNGTRTVDLEALFYRVRRGDELALQVVGRATHFSSTQPSEPVRVERLDLRMPFLRKP